MLAQKYKDVVEKSEKKKIMFPGWGDKPQKEDPSGDFIIFHEVLKFMRGGKDGLNNTDVIFLTRDEKKGDWFDEERVPIIHYIEKAFLLTNKSLFIIHPDQPLEISFENIHKSSQQELSPEIWSENKLYSIKKNGSISAAYMGHYRGWTILVFLSSYDRYWNTLAVNTLCYNYADFMQLINDGNTILTTLGQRFSSKEEGYIKMKFEIDKTFEYP